MSKRERQRLALINDLSVVLVLYNGHVWLLLLGTSVKG
jgi:hypothetical protein